MLFYSCTWFLIQSFQFSILHLKPRLHRYNDLKARIEELEDNLKNKENMGALTADIAEGLKKPKEYSEHLPQPRLQEADLQKYMSDIDEELETIHVLEEKIRDIESHYPEAATHPAVFMLFISLILFYIL